VARIMVIFGTRPEAIKLAPVIKALHKDPRFDIETVVTAQHRHMLDQVLKLFDIRPDVDLDMIRPRQTLISLAQRILAGLAPELERSRPDLILVQGDTTSAFVAALAAFYHGVGVAHLEAGLRTGDIWSPYPEEANRRLITVVSALNFAPTPKSAVNLLTEGVPRHTIVVTGNTVIDALLWAVKHSIGYGDEALSDLDDDPRRVLLVTAHRRESWGGRMQQVGAALAELAVAEPRLRIVIPLHRNPAVRETLLPALAGHDNITVTEPLDYAGFCQLMQRSHLILTDSGGVQEEGPSLGKPVLIMRDTTERPEGVAAGTARLIGTEKSRIISEVCTLLQDKAVYARMASAINPYGDGKAAERVVASLAHFFGYGSLPDPFEPATLPQSGPNPGIMSDMPTRPAAGEHSSDEELSGGVTR
jgi:UDP-N-acetylglucosamine 2-epimerase (non-hydrolysing)